MPVRKSTWQSSRKQRDSKRSVSGTGNRRSGRLKRRGRLRSRQSVIDVRKNARKEKDRHS